MELSIWHMRLRREGETDACTAYTRLDSDTMEGPFTQCSQNDTAPRYIVRRHSRHAYHSSIRHSFIVVHSLKDKS